MKIGDLRDSNIVFNANISAKRDQIPDLPIIYLVEPTKQNYALIAKDAREKLYDLMIVHFTKPVESLQEFANEMKLSK
jgi:sec1 family domain-containing protein 1